ncbi:MAG TPA: 50S ribosomal protein L22 [Nitrospiria bacterium]|nr:50S ribosomal protein L22 [Nitrospiria bacterium]HUK57555.1 50S ribosomal protein L22 [Nitrospiria bacterium]
MATEAKAILKFVRVAPRKARMVIDLIRGQQVAEALNILKFTPRAASRVVEKVLKSAVANAENLEIGDPDDLWVSRVYVDGGPILKRFNARSMGRANPIKKRTSHITVVVESRVAGAGNPGAGPAKKPKQAVAK